MAINDFVTFAADPAANVMTQVDYTASGFTARLLGFSTGTALSVQLNKVWRQSSIISSMIGQFTVDEASQDMLDDGTPGGMSALQSHFRLAVTRVAQGAVGTGYLPLTGGTLTGPLVVNGAAPALTINATAGQWAQTQYHRQAGMGAQIASYTGATGSRWAVALADAAPEVGSNTGSNFSITSFNDAGTYLDTPLSINRATGVVNFSHSPTVNNALLPYLPISGGTLTGNLGVGGTGINYPQLGGNWSTHHTAFGWDSSFIIAAVDGTYVGQLATVGWSYSLVGNYLPLAGGTLSGGLTINAGLVVGGASGFRSSVWFANLGDFMNFWDGRYRFRQWAGSWWDGWDGQTGLRIWASPSAWIMTLDGGGNLGMTGTVRASGGRVITQGYSNPAFGLHWPGVMGMAMWVDGSGLWFGNGDGNGNPTNGRVLIDGNGYMVVYGSGQANGNWYVAGTLTGVGAVNTSGNFNGNAIYVSYMRSWGNAQIGGQLIVDNINTNYIGCSGTINASGDINSGNNMSANTMIANRLTSRGDIIIANVGDFYLGGNSSNRILNFASGWYWQWLGDSGTLRWNRPGAGAFFDLQGDGALIYWGSPAYKYGNGSWWGLSDARSKNIEKEFTRGMEAIRQLKPMHYRYRQEAAPEGIVVPDDLFIGLTAQDVLPAIPEMVKQGATPFSSERYPDMMATDSTALLYTMLNAIKQLDARLTAQEQHHV